MNKDYQLPNMGGSTISTALTARLIEELRGGEYAHCQRLPSEVELAEHYGVSRSVIRDVLGLLEREGYVERGRGIGTLINRDIVGLNNRLDLKFEYNELIRGAGCTPSVDQTRLYTQPADEALAEKLQVDVGSTLIVSEKRMLASGRPVIFSIDHLPAGLFEGSNWQQLDWSISVFQLLWQQCGIVVDTNITGLTAQMGPPPVREKLEVQRGDALILLDEVGYYKLSRPILHSLGFYTNFFGFTMLRKLF